MKPLYQGWCYYHHQVIKKLIWSEITTLFMMGSISKCQANQVNVKFFNKYTYVEIFKKAHHCCIFTKGIGAKEIKNKATKTEIFVIRVLGGIKNPVTESFCHKVINCSCILLFLCHRLKTCNKLGI